MVTMAITVSDIFQVVLYLLELDYHHFCYPWPSVNLLVPLDQSYYQARPIVNVVTHVMSTTAALASDVVNAALLL